MPDPRETPAMQQYYRFKNQHPGCVLLFRVGDFYEMFDDDAVAVSRAIGLTLTQRTAGVPMAGVPFHQLDTYLRKLIRAGFRVAVCEQIQDARQAKGLVARAVTRVITPGTLVDETLVQDDAPATLAAVLFTEDGEDSAASLAVVEVSTGSFTLVDARGGEVMDELARRAVRELLYAQSADGKAPPRVKRLLDGLSISGTARPAWAFRHAEARETLLKHYGVKTLAGYGLSDEDAALGAAGALVHYLLETQTAAAESGCAGENGMRVPAATLAHLSPPRREVIGGSCQIDAAGLRALEVERTVRGQSLEGSLVGLFVGPGANACRTAMGKRLIREWLVRPLADVEAIRARQRAVAVLVEDRRAAAQLATQLERVNDVARISGRVSLGRATPRDVLALGRTIAAVPAMLAVLGATPALAVQFERLAAAHGALAALGEEIVGSCVDEPPAHLREGGLFRDGVDGELDELRGLQRDGGSWLASYQERLAAEHALPGLKVGFNRVFGYYIELSAAQARAFDERAGRGGTATALLRKQTLKNAERFTTAELREYEIKATSAEARAIEREQSLFQAVCAKATGLARELTALAEVLAELDALLGFAERAVRRGWRCPEVVDDPVLTIHGGRHPVLEELLGSNFVPNDVELGTAEAGGARLALITGPNMAGKSTFIRQTALLVLLAQAGSFVPADRATIGVTDRICTRVGADDALHAGQSTFMVEMTETANILHHVTARSLVVLDEIGRGTSTLDGLSLAWAITERLAGDGAGPRTLFATHYHELTDLEERLPGRVSNLHVEVREWPPGDPHAQIVFLHRILPGRTDQSYGIHVAKLAGLPAGVVERAREVLASLAVQHAGAAGSAAAGIAPVKPEGGPGPGGQFSLFVEYVSHPAVDELRELKLDELSPMQAFDVLRRLKEAVSAG